MLLENTEGLIRTSEVEKLGIGRYKLTELVNKGLLIRETKGVYSVPNEQPDEYFILQSRSSKLHFHFGTFMHFDVAIYIHQNPVKAGISKDLEYPFSSFSAYLDPEKSGIVDTEIPLAGMEYSEFLKMQYENNSDRCLAFPGKI